MFFVSFRLGVFYQEKKIYWHYHLHSSVHSSLANPSCLSCLKCRLETTVKSNRCDYQYHRGLPQNQYRRLPMTGQWNLRFLVLLYWWNSALQFNSFKRSKINQTFLYFLKILSLDREYGPFFTTSLYPKHFFNISLIGHPNMN